MRTPQVLAALLALCGKAARVLTYEVTSVLDSVASVRHAFPAVGGQPRVAQSLFESSRG